MCLFWFFLPCYSNIDSLTLVQLVNIHINVQTLLTSFSTLAVFNLPVVLQNNKVHTYTHTHPQCVFVCVWRFNDRKSERRFSNTTFVTSVVLYQKHFLSSHTHTRTYKTHLATESSWIHILWKSALGKLDGLLRIEIKYIVANAFQLNEIQG